MGAAGAVSRADVRHFGCRASRRRGSRAVVEHTAKDMRGDRRAALALTARRPAGRNDREPTAPSGPSWHARDAVQSVAGAATSHAKARAPARPSRRTCARHEQARKRSWREGMAANSCREAAIGSAFKKILRCGGRLGWGCQGGLGNGALKHSGEASRARQARGGPGTAALTVPRRRGFRQPLAGHGHA
jgi:hypothetical protein